MCCCNLTFACLHQDGQTCCFLYLVLRFYVERVFRNFASPQPQDQRCSSALANAFVSIRRDIHKCVSSRFSDKVCFNPGTAVSCINNCALFCSALPLRRGNTENSRLPARSVHPGAYRQQDLTETSLHVPLSHSGLQRLLKQLNSRFHMISQLVFSS